ncbi:MAG: hypothetical protein Q7S29_05255 [Candidatus Peribacter sp.]|nr:hypothetical protein [Candidatus Peribacter sp.]
MNKKQENVNEHHCFALMGISEKVFSFIGIDALQRKHILSARVRFGPNVVAKGEDIVGLAMPLRWRAFS